MIHTMKTKRGNDMGIVVIGTVFVDVKGFPNDTYVPNGRNAGRVEYVHGGVARNVVEDIANMELRPIFVSSVDDTALGRDVVEKLNNHKVNTEYVSVVPDSMGTWLAVFDHNGDLAGSISKRPDHSPILHILEEKGDEIIGNADSVILQADLHKDIVKRVFKLAEKYNKKLYALVSNMQLATERRDFVQHFDCFICNKQEAGRLFLDNYEEKTAEEMQEILVDKVVRANIPSMVVTLGGEGSVYADKEGNITFSKEPIVGDQIELALATHNQGGIVIVQVSKIIKKISPKEVAIHKSLIDYVWNQNGTLPSGPEIWCFFARS